jgi:hypothetical protein
MFARRDGRLWYVLGDSEYDLAPEGDGMVVDGYGAITAAALAGDHSALAVLRSIAPVEYIGLRDATSDAAGSGDMECLAVLLDDCDREWSTAVKAALDNGQTKAAIAVLAAIGRVEGAEAAEAVLADLEGTERYGFAAGVLRGMAAVS